ncbi:MAG: helix-turn-helix transcriptional regulator [Oscillibacter sp.]|nr:helix-turn-helix transcriptional regulator [Oscillibacter sp.]
MSTTFYEIYRHLCKRAGKSDNAVAAEIGLSNSTVTTWRQGALPRRPTLKKVADYFGVTDEYLMGTTIESQIDLTESKLEHLQAVLDFSESNEQDEVERQIEALEKTHSDLCATRDNAQKKPALTEKDRRDVAKDVSRIMESLETSGDLMFDGVPMTEESKAAMAAAMRVGLEEARRRNKVTYTPKKYRGQKG